MLANRNTQRTKVRILGALTLASGMVFSSCSMVDVRHNLVAGTMSFVKGYTTNLWEALLPAAEDLVGANED